MEKIKQLFNELENDISSENFIKLYGSVREKYPFITSYLTPKDLVSFLHNQDNADYPLNDKILSSLILEYQSRPDTGLIGSYLLIIFRPGLMKLFSLFRKRAGQFSSMSDMDLWAQIVTLFFEELHSINLASDNQKITSKIIGRIRNALRGYFNDLFRALNTENNLTLNPEPAPSSETESPEVASLLQNLVGVGVISEADRHILLATSVYKKSMKELSLDLKGLSYANIRQRKIRAQRAICAYLRQKSEKK